jgi:hypothetical protein
MGRSSVPSDQALTVLRALGNEDAQFGGGYACFVGGPRPPNCSIPAARPTAPARARLGDRPLVQTVAKLSRTVTTLPYLTSSLPFWVQDLASGPPICRPNCHGLEPLNSPLWFLLDDRMTDMTDIFQLPHIA